MKPFSKSPDTLQAAAERLRRGEQTCVQLLESCLARIDEREAGVRAWVLVDREGARRQAEERDAELGALFWRGPLHGIPVAIKDIIDVGGWRTGFGAQRWAKGPATRDATVVERLRAAGAVIVGKTVTTPYASFDPPVTRNPWNLARTPGGSSSGSAAALACGMCYGALGSQTGGSITRPAAYCGVAGCKPTYGRVSTDGFLPLAPSMDHPGTLAPTVEDAAILLDAIAGPDARDPTCSTRAFDPIAPWLRDGVRLPRIGRMRGHFEEHAEPVVRQMMADVCHALQTAGAVVIEAPLPARFAGVIRSHRIIMAVEAAAFHEERLRDDPDDYPKWIRQLLDEGLAARGVDYARAGSHQDDLSRAMLECFEDVDILLAPATTGPAPDASSTGDPAFNSPWSFTRLPVVSFPVAWTDDGLPLGIQLVVRPFEEKFLFQAARWCEAVLQG